MPKIQIWRYLGIFLAKNLSKICLFESSQNLCGNLPLATTLAIPHANVFRQFLCDVLKQGGFMLKYYVYK